MSNAMSAMQREGWIFSTAARRITLAPHCVSRMFMRNKNCTMPVENPAGKSPPPSLHLVQHRPRQPARANHAIRLAAHAGSGPETRAAPWPRRHPRSRSNRRGAPGASPSISAPPLPMGAGNSRALTSGNSAPTRRTTPRVLSRQPLSTTTSWNLPAIIPPEEFARSRAKPARSDPPRCKQGSATKHWEQPRPSADYLPKRPRHVEGRFRLRLFLLLILILIIILIPK